MGDTWRGFGAPRIVKAEPRYKQADSSKFTIVLNGEPKLEPELMPIWELDGVGWFDADPPPRRHDHVAQSVSWIDGEEIWRCACGANGGPREPWHYITRHHERFAPENNPLEKITSADFSTQRMARLARQTIWEHIVSFGWNIFFFLAGVVFLVVSIHLAMRYW